MNVLGKYNAKVAEAWYETAPAGKYLYIMRRGVFGWGTPMFLIVGIGFYYFGIHDRSEMSTSDFVVWFVTFHVGGAFLGWITWHHNLRKYGTSPDDA